MKLSTTTGILLFAASNFANAGLINGGSDIIDNDDLTQLSDWLGKGDIDLTNIFTKSGGNNSQDWHAAVDDKGATFTLIESTFEGNTYIFGGYNDYSWNSAIMHNQVDATLDKSFLFSLTTNKIFERKNNNHSTSSANDLGATFGAGHDLYIDATLSTGYSNLGASYGENTLYGSVAAGKELAGNFDGWQIQKYESFTVNASQVPEPSTLAIYALGIIGLVSRRLKKKS